MRQRVNIEELEQSTKIRAKYLRALENEEFGLLPGPHLRQELPAHLCGEARARPAASSWRSSAPSTRSPSPSSSSRSPRRRATRRRRPPTPRFGPGAAIAVAVVALVGFLLVLGLTGGEDEPEQSGRRRGPRERRAGRAPRRRRPGARQRGRDARHPRRGRPTCASTAGRRRSSSRERSTRRGRSGRRACCGSTSASAPRSCA